MNNNELNKHVMTVKDLSIYLDISLPKAYELTKRQGFPHFKVGKKTIIPIVHFDKWIAEQCMDTNLN